MKSRSNLVTRTCVIAGALALGVVPALAQTTPPAGADYSASINTFGTTMTTTINNNLGAILGVAAVFFGLGLAWKLLKRAVKAV